MHFISITITSASAQMIRHLILEVGGPSLREFADGILRPSKKSSHVNREWGKKMDSLSSFLEAKTPIPIARQQIGTSSEEGSAVSMEASPLGFPGELPGVCWPGLSTAEHSTALSGPGPVGRVLR